MKHLRTFENYNNENTSTSIKKPIHYLVHYFFKYEFTPSEEEGPIELHRRDMLYQQIGRFQRKDLEPLIDKFEFIHSDHEGHDENILVDEYRAILTPEEFREFFIICEFNEADKIRIDEIRDEKANELDQIYEEEKGYVRAVVFENESEGLNVEEDAAFVTPIFSQNVKNELNQELNKYSEEQRKVIEQRTENKFEEILKFLYNNPIEYVKEDKEFPDFTKEMIIDVDVQQTEK